MNFKKLLTAAMTMLCMCALLCTGVFAIDLNDPRFADKTWEQIVADFLAEKGVDQSKVTVGYYNTVTGEEQYLNKGVLMYGASVAKLPTNMVFAERISKGEMSFDTLIRGNRYESLQKLSLINSDNPAQATMVAELGGGNYANFRRAILPYIGLTEEEVSSDFLKRNFFAPEHILASLKLLYGNADRFPGVEECMKQAFQYDFFCGNQPPYTIAHKYGWYNDNGTEYVNDSAIVYTDDPFLLVMFTKAVGQQARSMLADFCSLMIDYTQYQRAIRYLDTAAEETALTLPTKLEYIIASPPSATPEGYAQWQLYFLGAGAAALLLFIVLVCLKKWAALFFLVLALALAAIGVSPTAITGFSVEQGYAQQSIEAFAADFNENRGVDYLDRWDNVMDPVKETDLNSAILNKVSESFTVQVESVAQSGNYITADVTYTKADIEAINAALQPVWDEALLAAVAAANVTDLFDEAGAPVADYLTQANEDALRTVLDDWDSYLITEKTQLHLKLGLNGYTPAWKLVANENLLNMVNYK